MIQLGGSHIIIIDVNRNIVTYACNMSSVIKIAPGWLETLYSSLGYPCVLALPKLAKETSF